MPARKRGRQEAELDASLVVDATAMIDAAESGTVYPGTGIAATTTTTATTPLKDPHPMLTRLRNTWQFAAFMQYLFLFGKVVKVDDEFDMDEFELECLKPEPSRRLQEVGLQLLKYVSSHRGLTMDIFDEYTRRQYLAKAPHRNPFGLDQDPNRFLDMDVFTKIRVLYQLSVWTLGNAERIRQMMPEQTEKQQTTWRIEELGWDRHDRAYFVLDDDRLYRRTDAPLPPTPKKPKSKPKSKSKSKSKSTLKARPRPSRGTRSSKRIKLDEESDEEQDAGAGADADEHNEQDQEQQPPVEDDDFGGMKWECVAVTLDEYQDFLESLRRSTDPNEKQLRNTITEDIMPTISDRAEKQRQKLLKKQRELENLEKMATAKRSSRIAGRKEQQRQQEEAEEAERKRLADVAMAKKEQHKQRLMEEARESRMLTREQRLKEREVKRILHEEELKRLEENQKELENNGDARMSERHLKSEMERRQKELDKLAEEEDDWVFDCAVCGMHGENLDDGTHSIACEKCSIWQHSSCHGIREEDAEREDFHFVCSDCRRKDDEARKPKLPPLKLRIAASNSPQLDTHAQAEAAFSNQGIPFEKQSAPFPSQGAPLEKQGAPFEKQSAPFPNQGAPSSDQGAPFSDQDAPFHANNNNNNNNTKNTSNNTSRYRPAHSPRPTSSHASLMNGPALSPQGQSPGPPGYHPHGPSPVGIPQRAWPGSTLPPPARPDSAGYGSSPPPQHRPLTNGHAASPPPFRLHQQAHASAVASSNLPHLFHPYQAPAQPNGSSHMGPPSPQKPHSRPTTGYDPSAPRPRSPLNANSTTPQQQSSARLSMSPQSRAANAPPPHLSYSPSTSFPPPAHPTQYQLAAGYSPIKQASSSPAHAAHLHHEHATPSSSQPQSTLLAHAAATPHNHTNASHHNILRPSPGAPLHSSPIPPLPTGNTPLIPQKHDTPRPASRDSIGEIPVFPPGVKMSPNPATSIVRPCSSSGPTQSFGQLSQQTLPNSQSSYGSFSQPTPSRLGPTAATTPTHSAHLPAHSPGNTQHRNQYPSSQPKLADDGGIAGIETELGTGSVPVKKMPPPTSSQPTPHLMSSPLGGDNTMRDA